jgi:hypothetical protein
MPTCFVSTRTRMFHLHQNKQRSTRTYNVQGGALRFLHHQALGRSRTDFDIPIARGGAGPGVEWRLGHRGIPPAFPGVGRGSIHRGLWAYIPPEPGAGHSQPGWEWGCAYYTRKCVLQKWTCLGSVLSEKRGSTTSEANALAASRPALVSTDRCNLGGFSMRGRRDAS